MRDGRRDENGDRLDWRAGTAGRADLNIGQRDDGQGAETKRMFGIRDGRNQI